MQVKVNESIIIQDQVNDIFLQSKNKLQLSIFESRYDQFVESLKNAGNCLEDCRKNKEDSLKNTITYHLKENSFDRLENLFRGGELNESIKLLVNSVKFFTSESLSKIMKLPDLLKKHFCYIKENYEKLIFKSGMTLLDENGSYFFDQADNNLTEGLYKDADGNTFFGKFRDGYLCEGLFLKREIDCSTSYYFGRYYNFNDVNNAKFEGIHVPSIKEDKQKGLIYFDGEIIFNTNTLNGLCLFSTEKENFEIFKGTIKNGQKEGKSATSISFSTKENGTTLKDFIVNKLDYLEGRPTGKVLQYYSEKHLIEFNTDDKKEVNSIYLKINGSTPQIYIGQAKNNDETGIYTPHGSNGRLYISNNQFYFGDVKDGIREGSGIYYYKDDFMRIIIVQGSFENDRIISGSLFINDQLKYEGEFENNSFIRGHYLFDKNEHNVSYQGSFLNGKRNGKGKNQYSDGSCYDGKWESDQRHGKGTYCYSDDAIKFDGNWKNNQKEGESVIEKGTLRLQTNWGDNKLLQTEVIK